MIYLHENGDVTMYRKNNSIPGLSPLKITRVDKLLLNFMSSHHF